MKRFLSVLGVVVLVGLFGGTLWYLWAKSQEKPVLFDTQAPEVKTIVKKTVATGSVVPREEVAIKPQISGIIDEVYVEAGDQIAAGDLIAKIRLIPRMVELNNAENRLNRAKIAFDKAERDLGRYRQLAADGTISQSEFQEVEVAYRNAAEELQAATDNLDLIRKGTSSKLANTSNTLVRATIAGTVLEVPVKVGSSVIESNTFNDGTTIAAIADMSDMIFEGRVDESEVGKLRPGMDLLLTVGAVEDQTLEAVLEHIAPKGVEENGAIQFAIRAALKPQQDVTIRANYSANADVVLDRREQVLAIPEALVEFEGEKAFVEVETAPQQFERREIQVGLSDGIDIEVVSGLTAEDRLKAGEAKGEVTAEDGASAAGRTRPAGSRPRRAS